MHNGDAWLDKSIAGHERAVGKRNWLGECERRLSALDVDVYNEETKEWRVAGLLTFDAASVIFTVQEISSKPYNPHLEM